MDLIQSLALWACLALAGCAGAGQDAVQRTASIPDSTTELDGAAAQEGVHLRGHVLTAALVPIDDANVSVVATGLLARTGADGAFDFGRQPARIYSIIASAGGFLDGSLTVTPEQAGEPLKLVLEAGYPVTPYNTTVAFTGILECAFEALIISPSCDSVLTVVPGAPRVFDEAQSFLFNADLGWKTLVLDVVFDGDAQPGLDGLRIALRGSLDPNGGGEYLQYGRWNDPHSFTIRVEPGGNYTEGVEPVPSNATGFQVDAYPHSHLWHAGGVSPFLGVGVGSNVRFDLYATLFYVDGAPEGFTLQEA